MKKFGISAHLFLFVFVASSQMVRMEPIGAGQQDEIKIIFNSSLGNGELRNVDKIYMHSGVVFTQGGTAWQNVIGNWGQDDGIGEMSKVEGSDSLWQLILNPNVRQYYNVSTNDQVFRLSMVFRDKTGSTKASIAPSQYAWGTVASSGDIYLDLPAKDFVTFIEPTKNELVIDSGTSLNFLAIASRSSSELKIEREINGEFTTLETAQNVTSFDFKFTPSVSGTYVFKVTATIEGTAFFETKSLTVAIRESTEESPLPSGMIRGINYHKNDPTKATLVLEAPLKEFVYIVGDMTQWEINSSYKMKKDPATGWFWVTLENLMAGKEYVFQYWVDGTIKIGDPFSEKIADPWNDSFIPSETYPDLPIYDRVNFGIASVLQTQQPEFQWDNSEDTWKKPNIKDLVVYELLVRDFVGSHDYKDLIDTLGYLKNLGINAIELMPVMEFEGNESWGYNPMYFFAPDKYYGTKNDLKEFIQAAHKQGIAVILDIVLNHAFGLNPWVRMYWDEQNGRPAENSPYFNPVAKHPFNVGYDFNHSSALVKHFIDSVNIYWIKEYHADGFRYDLSKGFTQNNTGDNVGAWSAYDPARIANIKRMNNVVKSFDSTTYVILEHFADQREEDELAAEGMLLWRNSHGAFSTALKGSNSNINSASHLRRVSYMESHDEERQMFDMITNGQSKENYSVRIPEAALERAKMGAAFTLLQRGPKMIWQFGELGYDISINFNGRVGNKPLPWGAEGLGYYSDDLRQFVYQTYASLLALRNQFPNAFSSESYTQELSGAIKKISINHEDLKLVLIGNFGLETANASIEWPIDGIWHDYFSGEEVNSTINELSISPGFFRLFTKEKLSEGFADVVEPFQNPATVNKAFRLDDEITITFDASKSSPDGTAGLIGANKIYMHAGLVVDSPDGEDLVNIVGTLTDDGLGLMQPVNTEENTWSITLVPRSYFNLSTDDVAYRIGMYFRDADNSNRGKGFRNRLIYFDIRQDGEAIKIEPDSFYTNQSIKIIFDASYGEATLIDENKIYVHSGVVLTDKSTPEGSDWAKVVGNWGQDDGLGELTPVANNKWEINLTPKSYYNLAANDSVYWLSMVFRNASGNKKAVLEPGSYSWGLISSSGDAFYKVIPPKKLVVEEPLSTGLGGLVTLFPNPAHGHFEITSLETDLPAYIHIVSLGGQVMLSHTLSESPKVSIDHLMPGLYIVHIQSGDRLFVRKLWVIR